ncbi:hypothetical protein F5884DRAFT_354869 [Xylogone sp. PMI_703]|nr:hypothetical protein F5884DRAFT_354869 [Xylogone sp. PMI_703]
MASAEPILSTPTRSNPSLFSFGTYNSADGNQTPSTPSFDFLPTASFDDLHKSIASASSELGIQLLADEDKLIRLTKGGRASMGTMDMEGRGITGPRSSRSGSLLHRQSASRKSSISSTASNSSAMDPPPTGPLGPRPRRYPPLSGIGLANAKAPRKSIGPGVIDTDYGSKGIPRRRPSLTTSSSSSNLADASARISIGSIGSYTEPSTRPIATARSAKSKSLQPPSRQNQSLLSVQTMTPEHNRSLSFAGRSPNRGNGKTNSTPSSNKRMSVMPGTHATGLGARTISPTDARRAKRLSTYQGAPPLPTTPQKEGSAIRHSSRSPSMLPLKTSTPNSASTTPDINRKLRSSDLSFASDASYNTSRTSTGSIQPRLSLGNMASRLPTPKVRNIHSSTGHNEEDVPPVPAIPKAYESPKDSPAEQPFFKRKSSMPFDASSINSTSTNSLSGKGSLRDSLKPEREQGSKKTITTPSTSDHEQKPIATPSKKKKNLQPLRLPPLNLLPLSTPTTAKIAALQDPSSSEGNTTPPTRVAAKTPSTPMTASKASFFSRNRGDKKSDQTLNLQGYSPARHLRSESTNLVGPSKAEFVAPMPIATLQPRQTRSPFLSTSLPKADLEGSFMAQAKIANTEYSTIEVSKERLPPRLTGPRPQKVTKPTKSETPQAPSSPEPSTPSSTSSLRRKLSLGWKRSNSKSNINFSHTAGEKEFEHPPQPPKHDMMPPPKVPASATMNNLSTAAVPSPSPSTKSIPYLDSRRRKSSASSLNVLSSGHDRVRNDSWGSSNNPPPKKDHSGDAEVKPATITTRPSTSGLHRPLNPKTSAATIKSHDPWVFDMDKDDLSAEDEMKKLGQRRKETEQAARQLDSLRKRATPKERVSAQHAIQMANLNIYERGEVVDYKEVYFCGTQNAAKHVGNLQSDAPNFGYDDERGDYQIVLGDHLSYRYEVVNVLGKGSFGQVVRCIDHKTGGLVAVKIIRNKKRFHQQALVEVNILQKLREWDPKNKHCMVNFVQSFYFRGHLCISTELLDMNLYEFIKSNSFRGFSLKIVRRFTKQLLSSLCLLKKQKVIHCDLKPENILLTHPLHSEIKVIDFGSSCFEHEKVYTYIQSRFYRSPEVILGMTYGMPIDMWSLGCILAELYTGVPIFPGENEQEQLACIMEVFGPPEKHLIEKSSRRKLFFDSLGKPRLTVSSKGRRRRPSSKTLQQVLKCDDEAFLDFLARCLRWDPDRRMKPDEAIYHEFITGQKPSAPPPARLSGRNESPIKRYNTVATQPPAGSRPLPEPPTTSLKNGQAVRNSGSSPNKPTSARRQSTVSGVPPPLIPAAKRTSTGAVLNAGASNLPRVTRSVSAKQDMASAGATVAMTRRAA